MRFNSEVELPFEEENRAGAEVCVWCGNPLEGRQRRWCSGACVEEYLARKGYGFRDAVIGLNRESHGELTCESCGDKPGEENVEADHVEPVALGGSNDPEENGQLLCRGCHVEKTGEDLERIRNYRSGRTHENQVELWSFDGDSA